MTLKRLLPTFAFLIAILLPDLLYAQESPIKEESIKEGSIQNKHQPLKIVFVKDNAPFSLLLPDGTPTGLYVEFWQLWSKTNHIPIKFYPETYANAMRKLKNHQVDFHVGLFVNDSRTAWGDFSIPFHRVDTGIFFRGNQKAFPKLSEMKGRKVAVQAGTFQHQYLVSHYPDIKIYAFVDAELILNGFLNNEFDAIVSEIPYLNSQIAKMGLRGVFKLSDESLLTNEVRAFIPKADNNVTDIINAGIKKMPVNQVIALEKKWLPSLTPYWSSQNKLASLTMDEKDWLKLHNHFSIGIDHNWSPFEFVDNNNDYSGVSSEYTAILQEKLGVEFKPDYNRTWIESFKALKNHQIDVIPAIVKTEQRAKSMSFTKPYISLASVILTRKDTFYVQGIEDLSGKKVGVIGDYVFESILKENHPDIKIVAVASVKKGMELVESGDIDAFIDALATINHELNKGNHKDIIVAAFTPYPLELSMAVSSDLAPLTPILDKALSSITTKQKSRIANNWLAIEVNLESNFQTFLYWGLPIGSVLLMIILFVLKTNRRMQFEILERKKTEQLLESAKEKAEAANQTKDNFLANMSHEIRTPMNAVVGMSHLLEKSGLTDQQKGYQETLNSSAESLLVLIDDILDLSKVEAGKLELEVLPFSLTEVVKNVENQVRLIIDESKIKLVTKLSSQIPRLLYGDSNRLRQVILNLVNNAAKFTQQGKIEISAKINSKKGKKIEIEFCVSDTGIGIDIDQQKNLFQNYSQADSSTTRQYGGTGLGLAISKNLCELMGGKIWLTSQAGVGSQFNFKVTLEYKDGTDSNIAQELLHTRNEFDFLKDKNILLVDDNDVNLMVARMILSNAGMEVVTAKDGKEAIEQLKQGRFDAILMDIQMPVMDGYQATRYIRKEMGLTNIPIIAVSANVMKPDLKKSLDSGMDAHIGKPLNVNKLLSTLVDKISS